MNGTAFIRFHPNRCSWKQNCRRPRDCSWDRRFPSRKSPRRAVFPVTATSMSVSCVIIFARPVSTGRCTKRRHNNSGVFRVTALYRAACRKLRNSSLSLKTVADIAGRCPCCDSTKSHSGNGFEAGLQNGVSLNCDPSASKGTMQKFIARSGADPAEVQRKSGLLQIRLKTPAHGYGDDPGLRNDPLFHPVGQHSSRFGWTSVKSGEDAGETLGRNSGCDHAWHIERCNRRSEQKIEAIKRSACGYRNKDDFRTAILFHCGKPDWMRGMGR